MIDTKNNPTDRPSPEAMREMARIIGTSAMRGADVHDLRLLRDDVGGALRELADLRGLLAEMQPNGATLRSASLKASWINDRLVLAKAVIERALGPMPFCMLCGAGAPGVAPDGSPCSECAKP